MASDRIEQALSINSTTAMPSNQVDADPIVAALSGKNPMGSSSQTSPNYAPNIPKSAVIAPPMSQTEAGLTPSAIAERAVGDIDYSLAYSYTQLRAHETKSTIV